MTVLCHVYTRKLCRTRGFKRLQGSPCKGHVSYRCWETAVTWSDTHSFEVRLEQLAHIGAMRTLLNSPWKCLRSCYATATLYLLCFAHLVKHLSTGLASALCLRMFVARVPSDGRLRFRSPTVIPSKHPCGFQLKSQPPRAALG